MRVTILSRAGRACLGALGLLTCTACDGGSAAGLSPRFPLALEPGDTIALVVPAGPLAAAPLARARARLEALGYQVEARDDSLRRDGYLAGSDETRAQELMDAFRDPAVKAIFCGGGGYGTMRLLEQLDYDYIRRHPKIVVGYSDITGLHLALAARAGLITFQGPNGVYDLGREQGLHPVVERHFWRALAAEEFRSTGGMVGYEYDFPDSWRSAGNPGVLVPGVARGRLVGGNLSLVSALVGTPYAARTHGKILFLEDVGERPYRIDRMLRQMKLAGQLEGLAGVLLGRFPGCKPKDAERSWSLERVLDDYFGDLGVPVLSGFPAGHGPENLLLPLGVLVEVDADRGQVRVLENPVRVSPEPSLRSDG